MAAYDLLVVEGGKPKKRASSGLTIDVTAIRIGASNLTISESSSHFGFGTKKLTGVTAGTANGEVLVHDQRGAANGLASLDASSLVPITQIPPAALERLVVVADQAARFALTTATVQNGDTVKQTDTGEMWFVKDDTSLDDADGYTVYTAGTASAVPWSGVTGTPTTVAGYGITDVLSTAVQSGTITDGVTKAPTHDAVFDALALKADAATAVSYVETGLTNNEGGAITVRQAVYLTSAANVQLAQANDTLAPWTKIRMVKTASIADGNGAGEFWKPGATVAGFTGLTFGGPVYLSRSSAGGYQQDLSGFVAGEHVVLLGRAISTTEIEFNPEYLYEF